MAKNKQKAPTQPQTTKNLDLSDPRKVERFVSSEFEVSRQYLKKIRKEHPERKNILEETEMVEPFYSRRISAATNYLPVMMKRFEKYQSVKPDDYTVFFSQPTLSISSLDYRGSLSTGAALWILDTLKDCRKMKKLYENIPWLPDDDPTEMPIIFDPCHSHENIKGLVFVIQSWFENRLSVDSQTSGKTQEVGKDVTKEPHGVKVNPDPCAHFSAILDLIPDETKNRAVRRLEDKVWEWADIYLSILNDIISRREKVEEKIQVLDDEIGEITKRLKQKGSTKNRSIAGNQSGKMNTVGPVMAPFASPVSPFASLSASGSVPSGPLAAPSFSIMGSYQNDPLELVRRIDRLEDERSGIIEEEKSLRMWAPMTYKTSTKGLTEKLGAENAKRFIEFRVDDPFEMCLAFLCLLDRDDDLAWLYSFTLSVMDAVCGQLPWAKGDYDEDEDTIWHPHDFFEMLLDDNEDEEIADYSVDRYLDEDWFGLKYTTDDVYEMDNERASIAQIVYQMTGAVLPRNTYRYDGMKKRLRKDGLSNTRIDRAVSAMMILGEVQRRSRNWMFDEFSFDDLMEKVNGEPDGDAPDEEKKANVSSDLADTIEKLKAENVALKKENDRLRQAAHAASREVKESQQNIEKLEQEAEEHTQELADLRELVFNQQNGEYEKDTPDTTITFPYETRHRIVVFGGHDSWLREIRQKLPAVRFVDREASPNADLIRNADVIWIQANSLAHKHYYKIIDIVRKYNKPIRYFAYASATKCAEQVVAEDRKG